MEWVMIPLVGLVALAAGVAPLWLLRDRVRGLSRRAQLGVGLVAWLVETGWLVGGLLFAVNTVWLPPPPTPGAGTSISLLIVQEIVLVVAMLGALALPARVWGAPSWADVGLGRATRRYALRDTLFGLALGPVAVGVFLVAGLIGGWNRVTGLAPLPDLLGTLVLGALFFLVVGIFEEVSGRGCLFALLARLLGLPAAWAISVVVFGLLHGSNPGATPVALAGVALAGVVFALALVRTGALWLPIAFHLSWNWAEGPLYGYPVSGTSISAALRLEMDPAAPEWATGGVFGPEASVFVLVALGLAGAAIWLYTRNRPGPALLFPAGAPERETRNEE